MSVIESSIQSVITKDTNYTVNNKSSFTSANFPQAGSESFNNDLSK